jgi:double-stranded uracil-DNA glycosylase
MQRSTVDAYEQHALEWEQERAPRHTAKAMAFATAARRAIPEAPVIDLGCGPGWTLPHLGDGPTIALDAARAMLELVPRYDAGAWRVQADLSSLPFRRGCLAGAWASRSYVHLARAELPRALADLHRCLPVGAVAELIVFSGDQELGPLADDDFPGRQFSLWSEDHLRDVLTGAGFEVEHLAREPAGRGDHLCVRLRRERMLADTVAPDMELLVVGLNPSFYAADAGVGFARPGNRFWPAALAAGLVTRDRDARHALDEHGIGMTDLVKRATARADELLVGEYRKGLARVTRLVSWLQPRAVCLVGLAGWRAAVDRRATPGWQPTGVDGAPAYLMPSTSGLNARTSLTELTAHLLAAAARAP